MSYHPLYDNEFQGKSSFRRPHAVEWPEWMFGRMVSKRMSRVERPSLALDLAM